MTAEVTFDWLRSVETLYKDTELMARLLPERELNPGAFEDHYGLGHLPDSEVPAARINRMLNASDARIRVETSTQDNLLEQMRSRIPRQLVLSSLERESLAYALSRIVVDDIPRLRSIDWSVPLHGLDELANAVLFLHNLGNFLGQRIAWLDELMNVTNPSMEYTIWPMQNTRPDGASVSKFEELIVRFRSSLVSIRYHPLTRIIIHLRDVQESVNLSKSAVSKYTGLGRKIVEDIMPYIQIFLSEHFVFSPISTGLQYRFIFHEGVRNIRWSNGITHRYSLDTEKFNGISVHLEPTSSPSYIYDKSFEVTVDRELLSFRLDLFQPDTQEGWSLTPFETQIETGDLKTSDNPRWLFLESPLNESPEYLTGRECDLLGLLLSHEGSTEERRTLLKLMKAPEVYYSRVTPEPLQSLYHKKIVSTLHIPNLDYTGLNDGVLLVVRNMNKSTYKSIKNYILTRIPYVKMMTNSANDTLVAELRMPLHRGGYLPALLPVQLLELEVDVSDFIIGQVQWKRNYLLNALSRIRDEDSQKWVEPRYQFDYI